MLDQLKIWFNTVLQFSLDVLLYVPRKCYELFTDAIIAAFAAVPAPGFLSDAAGYSVALGGTDVAYFLGLFQVPYGCGVILSAYVVRFLIRRLPFIG